MGPQQTGKDVPTAAVGAALLGSSPCVPCCMSCSQGSEASSTEGLCCAVLCCVLLVDFSGLLIAPEPWLWLGAAL